MRETINEKSKTIAELNKQIDEYRRLDERNRKLEERELLLTQKENRLEIETLKHSLSCEHEKTEFAKSVALGLVRNIEYRKSAFDNRAETNFRDHQGNLTQVNNTNSTDETYRAD